MSLFGGGGSSKTTNIYVPQKIPAAPPTRTDPFSESSMLRGYREAKEGKASYTRGILGGGAPNPHKSYSAKLFGAS